MARAVKPERPSMREGVSISTRRRSNSHGQDVALPPSYIDDKAAIESRKTGTEDESKVSGRVGPRHFQCKKCPLDGAENDPNNSRRFTRSPRRQVPRACPARSGQALAHMRGKEIDEDGIWTIP